MPKTKVFFSYCRQDTTVLAPIFGEFKSLLKSVSVAKQTYKIDYYWDAQNIPGQVWDHNIKWWLMEADVIVFFVTPQFLSSTYIQVQEIPIALTRMENSGIHILPILIEDCGYSKSAIGHLQFIPVKHNRLKPYNEWRNKKEFRELTRFALKLSIKNSIVGNPHQQQFQMSVLTPSEKSQYSKLFASPEIVKLEKLASRKKTKKKPQSKSLIGKLKKIIGKLF